jgi:hypothetical protein
MKKLKLSTLLIILFISFKTYSQNINYLVTKNNDTLFGEKVIIRKNKIGILKSGNTIFYNDTLLIGYFKTSFNLDGESYYERVQSPSGQPGAKMFMKRKINGRIKMYSTPTQNGSYYYISKNNSELVLIPSGQLKFRKESTYIVLKKYIEDAPIILDKIKTIGNKQSDFENLINEYNLYFKKQ